MNNGIAAHPHQQQHEVDWDSAKVRYVEKHHWKRKVLEAIHILRTENTSNLECRLQVNLVWFPIIKKLQ